MEIVGWYVGNSEKKTHEVGRKNANELGLYDMSGNVWENLHAETPAFVRGPGCLNRFILVNQALRKVFQ